MRARIPPSQRREKSSPHSREGWNPEFRIYETGYRISFFNGMDASHLFPILATAGIQVERRVSAVFLEAGNPDW